MHIPKKYPRLKYPLMEPPGGFIFRDLDTNVWMASHVSLKDLIQQCKNHRRANKLVFDEDEFSKFIEATICYSIDPALVLDLPDDHNPSKQMLTLYKANKCTTDYLQKWKNKGQKLVPQEEARNRSAMCLNCEFNATHICLTCKGIDEWIYGWTRRKTVNDKRLGICQCDAVILFASVHARYPGVPTNGQKITYPEYCWKKPEEISHE